jgi:hypothetical protein
MTKEGITAAQVAGVVDVCVYVGGIFEASEWTIVRGKRQMARPRGARQCPTAISFC